MRYSSLTRVFLCFLEFIFIHPTHTVGPRQIVKPHEACGDFALEQNSGLAWTLEDCIDVWTQHVDTIPRGQQRRMEFIDIWRESAMVLRRAGTPCLAASYPTGDGVGSTTIRLFASWIFAEEMGCDWPTPVWGKRHFVGDNGTSILYCHPVGTTDEAAMLSPDSPALFAGKRCSIIDWLDYFQFGVPSVSMPEGGTAKIIEIGRNAAEEVESLALALKNGGEEDQQWDHVIFQYQGVFASENLCSVGNWDETKRETTRKVLGEARHNFHIHQGPRFDSSSQCGYSTSRLNFALHVRMGDRRQYSYHENVPGYLGLLEVFMDTVSAEVVGMGLDSPLFHVFSETLSPCPSGDTGEFDEFPTWPVMLEPLPECLEAKAPVDCPERRAGRTCSAERSGIFNVVGKPIVLHVGHDVPNAMSCMIAADGLLMGCSTFGQMAGILTKGISFFSMQCNGDRSPAQYKMVPPLAVAERGHMWVPVAGSWRNPALPSTEALRRALVTHLENKNSS